MIFKMQAFFNEFQQGWTENWFLSQPDIENASKQATNVVAALLNIKADTVSCLGFRLVTVDNTSPKQTVRIVLNTEGDRPTTAGAKISGSEQEDVTQTCWNVVCRFADATQRTIQMRGLLDADVARSAVNGLAAPSDALVKAFAGMKSSLLKVPVYGQRQDLTVAKQRVLKVQADTKNVLWTELILDDNTSIAVGDRVHFTGVPLQQFPWFKGSWLVLAKNDDAEGISLGYPFNYTAPVVPLKWQVQVVKHTWTPLQAMVGQQFQSRKTGRPTKLTAGRARGIRFRR